MSQKPTTDTSAEEALLDKDAVQDKEPMQDSEPHLSFNIPFPRDEIAVIIAKGKQQFTTASFHDWSSPNNKFPTLHKWLKDNHKHNHEHARIVHAYFNVGEAFTSTKLRGKLKYDLKKGCQAVGGLIACHDYRAHTRIGLQGKWSNFSSEEMEMLERVQKSMKSMLETEMMWLGAGKPRVSEEAYEDGEHAVVTFGRVFTRKLTETECQAALLAL